MRKTEVALTSRLRARARCSRQRHQAARGV